MYEEQENKQKTPNHFIVHVSACSFSVIINWKRKWIIGKVVYCETNQNKPDLHCSIQQWWAIINTRFLFFIWSAIPCYLVCLLMFGCVCYEYARRVDRGSGVMSSALDTPLLSLSQTSPVLPLGKRTPCLCGSITQICIVMYHLLYSIIILVSPSKKQVTSTQFL